MTFYQMTDELKEIREGIDRTCRVLETLQKLVSVCGVGTKSSIVDGAVVIDELTHLKALLASEKVLMEKVAKERG